MFEYYIYFIFLWSFAFLEYLSKKNTFFISIIIFFIFLSLRVDTGYDWPVYKSEFDRLQAFDSLANIFSVAMIYNQEVGFIFLISLLKGISSNFQIVIFFIALIESYALYIFLKKTSKSPSAVIAVVGTWLLFTLYFSTLRQGLAVSFFLLFIIYMHEKFYIRAIVLSVLSLSMQVSSALYYLLYFFSGIKIKKILLIKLFVLSLLLGYVSQAISVSLFSLIQTLGIPVLSEKMNWYIEDRVTTVNIFDRVFVYVYSVSMFIFLYKTWHLYQSKLMIRLSFFALVYIFILLIFVDFPLMRNRQQYVSFIIQFVLIFNYFYYKKLYIRTFLIESTLVIVFSYYTMMLTKSYSIVFVPYQDYIRYGLFDTKSTGAERQYQMFDIKNK